MASSKSQPYHKGPSAQKLQNRVAEKTQSFEHFLNDVLREDLKLILSRRDELYQKVAEYMEQETILEKMISVVASGESREPLRTKIDLGCNFYAQGEIATPIKSIQLDVGCGIWLEMSIPDAVQCCKKRVEYFKKRIEMLTEQELEAKAKINVVLHGLKELQKLPDAKPPEESEPPFPRYE